MEATQRKHSERCYLEKFKLKKKLFYLFINNLLYRCECKGIKKAQNDFIKATNKYIENE